MNLPTTTPAETLNISPEALEIANCFLQEQDIHKVSDTLGISSNIVSEILNRREVKAYVDSVFLNVGFNNRFLLRQAMDTIIRKKFQELEESGIGSNKDIVDILALSHKMTMEEMARMIELEKLRTSQGVKNQVNVQINDGFSDGTRYGDLIQRLINANNVNN